MAALAIVCLLLAACGDDDGAGEDPASPSPSSTTEGEAPEPSPPSDSETDEPEDEESQPPTITDLADAAIVLTPIAEFDAPIAMATRSAHDELFVAERAGRVRTLVPDGSGGWTPGATVVDISSETTTDVERGLLGVAFHPEGNRLYVSFTDSSGDSRLDEWTLSEGDDGPVANADSRRTVYTHGQPYPNHNGGHIGFGPDGYLYLGLGDGGGGGDPLGAGQDPDTALGSIIRIDPAPDGDRSFSVPSDNPFADGGGMPEIFINGARNPWRFSWDSQTGDLWIADVGQNAIEEINLLPAPGADDGDGGENAEAAGLGANLGWAIFEGDQRFGPGDAPANYVEPIFTYGHGPGCSITGGFVVRDPRLADLYGAYLYADYCDPAIRAILVSGGEVVDSRSLDVEVPGGQVVSFGEGPGGELYALSLTGGVFRIDPQ